MNIILIGTGRMGRLLKECALDAGDAVVGEYGHANIAELAAAPAADVAIDFSGPETLPAVAADVARTGTPLVSGTTGYTDEQMQRINSDYKRAQANQAVLSLLTPKEDGDGDTAQPA